MKLLALALLLAPGLAFGQKVPQGTPAKTDPPKAKSAPAGSAKSVEDQEALRKRNEIMQAERDGVEVRVKGIAHFRGIRGNQLMGTGLVVGLAGSGDTKKSVITQQILTNMFRTSGSSSNPRSSI